MSGSSGDDRVHMQLYYTTTYYSSTATGCMHCRDWKPGYTGAAFTLLATASHITRAIIYILDILDIEYIYILALLLNMMMMIIIIIDQQPLSLQLSRCQSESIGTDIRHVT